MLFHTWTFVIFFTITMAGYLLLRRHSNLRLLWLLIASYVFYGWWNPLFLILIFYSTSLEYLAGLMIADTSHPLDKGYDIIADNLLKTSFLNDDIYHGAQLCSIKK